MLSKITSWRHSKIIAFVLAVAVFLTAFYAIAPVISNAEGNDSTNTVTYWDGSTFDSVEAAFAEQLAADATVGTSESNPFEITNGAQLYCALRTHAGYYFKIMNDICLQPDKPTMEAFEEFVNSKRTGEGSAALPQNTKSWYSLTAADTASCFAGRIDGGNHTISGLYIEDPWSTTTGLIPLVRDIADGSASTIKNITLDTAYCSSGYSTAGLVGLVRTSYNLNIDGCNVINSYIYNSNSSTNFVGGIIGYNMTGAQINISNCTVFGNTIEGKTTAQIPGNIIGTSQVTTTISKCLADGAAVGTAWKAPTYNNVHAATDISGLTNMKGVAAYDNMKGFTPAFGWIVKEADGYPCYVGLENLKNFTYLTPVWNGAKTLTIADLATDANGNFKVSTGTELYAALQNTEEGKTFDIVNDIYLNTADSDANNWELWQKYRDGTTNCFTGTINGNGYTIYGYQDIAAGFANNFSAQRGLGFIPVASNATIKNLHFSDVNINAWNAQGTGMLVGTATGAVKIEGCSVINATVRARLVASAFVGTLKENASVDIKESVFGSGTLVENHQPNDVFSVGAFVGKAETATATVSLTDVVSNGYKVVGDVGTVTPVRAYAIGANVASEGVVNYYSFEDLKFQLRTVASVQLSENFYWDNININTSPLLKNRIATKDKDIDGDGDTNLDTQDAAALVNIVLHDTTNQLTLSEGNVKGYNDLDGIDITDIVYIYANAN